MTPCKWKVGFLLGLLSGIAGSTALNKYDLLNEGIISKTTRFELVPKAYAHPLELEARAKENLFIKTLPNENPITCAEVLTPGISNGVYQLSNLINSSKPFYGYCKADLQNGAAWTVIQKREDGSIDFNRPWDAYKNGFGNTTGEFFIGLQYLHESTQAQKHELRIEMESFEGDKKFAAYDHFVIDSEKTNYALSSLGKFSGDAGDSMRYHEGHDFSTSDADHDMDEHDNCAKRFHGGWWYSSCYWSNLNGKYFTTAKNDDLNGIMWNSWPSQKYSLKYVSMSIRPVNLH